MMNRLRNCDGNEDLVAAARAGNIDELHYLLAHVKPLYSADLALRAAAEKGHVECLRILLPHCDLAP